MGHVDYLKKRPFSIDFLDLKAYKFVFALRINLKKLFVQEIWILMQNVFQAEDSLLLRTLTVNFENALVFEFINALREFLKKIIHKSYFIIFHDDNSFLQALKNLREPWLKLGRLNGAGIVGGDLFVLFDESVHYTSQSTVQN